MLSIISLMFEYLIEEISALWGRERVFLCLIIVSVDVYRHLAWLKLMIVQGIGCWSPLLPFYLFPPSVCLPSLSQNHFIFLVTFSFSLIFLGILKCLMFVLHFKISISEVIVLLSVAPGGFPSGNLCPCGCSAVWLYVLNFIWGLWDPYWRVTIVVNV